MSSTASDARLHVLADHDRLRRTMGRLSACAGDALDHGGLRPRVREALADLRTELEDHLAYEERVLVPLLRRADAWGPARAETLIKDHAGQRALLVALTEDAGDAARSIDALADEIAWFIRSLERDMCDEEATFLNAEALGDDASWGSVVAGR